MQKKHCIIFIPNSTDTIQQRLQNVITLYESILLELYHWLCIQQYQPLYENSVLITCKFSNDKSIKTISGNDLHKLLNSLLSDPEYIDIVYISLHVNYLNKILFKPKKILFPKWLLNWTNEILQKYFVNYGSVKGPP